MGPTNIALVKLFRADQALREAQARLDAAQRNVRIQEGKVADISARLSAAQAHLKERQTTAARLELDIKTRDAHIERLREQQRTATNSKVYQTFLVEINTGKVDRSKVEDEAIAVLDEVEKARTEASTLSTQAETEKAKLASMQAQIGDKVAELKAQVESLQPARDEAAEALPPRARQAFERLAEPHDGEAMSAISKPDRRREEYLCTACNMDLVTDVYNKLHSRDELVFCPSCRRILYIPDDLPPEMAVKKKEPRKEKLSASDEAKLPPKSKDAWTEEEFHTRVDRANSEALSTSQATLLETLRTGIPGYTVRFDGQGAVNPAYNVYVDGTDAYVLRVNADGRVFGCWNAFAESGQPEMSEYFHAALDPFVLDIAHESEPLASAERGLATVNMPELLQALRSVADKALARQTASTVES